MKSLYIAAGVVAGALLLAALVVGGRAVRRTYAKARTLEIQTSAVVEKQCDEARNRIRNFQAPFVAVPASVFVELGGFQPHEQLRDENKLTFVDSVKDDFFNNYLTVFVSHQWLGRDHPDPKNAQYAQAAPNSSLLFRPSPPPRNIRVVLRLYGIATSWPRRRRDPASTE